MRIAILTREYPPVTRVSGGIGRQLSSLATALVRAGHQVSVVTFHEGPASTREVDGVTLHLASRPRGDLLGPGWESLWPLLAKRALRRVGEVDVVLATEWGGDAALTVGRGGPPVVTNLATSLEQALLVSPAPQPRPHVRARRRLQAFAERRQTERSDAVVACSRALLGWTRELWDLDGIPSEIIPNAINVARTRELAHGAPPDGFPTGHPVIAFAGRLQHLKGVLVLVEAMRRVWDEVGPVDLVLLGLDTKWLGEPMSAHLRRLAGPDADRLHILGEQPPELLFPALARADVVALPSLWEAFGIAALEAMALGRPLVVTKGFGYDEFVRDGVDGVAVAPGDADALADALVALLRDQALRTRLGASARARSEGYDADAIAVEYARALSAAVAARQAARRAT